MQYHQPGMQMELSVAMRVQGKVSDKEMIFKNDRALWRRNSVVAIHSIISLNGDLDEV